MIGLAAVLLMACHGRIAGMTGIISGLLPPFPVRDRGWRAAFLLGAIGSPIAIGLVQAGPIPMQVDAKPLLLVLGGFIVGIGVTLGSGCTSGHGVCGLARLSPRSLVATLVFMASTALTVFAIRHVIGG
jgi:uncharacterized membrane protein YedE/YeeE